MKKYLKLSAFIIAILLLSEILSYLLFAHQELPKMMVQCLSKPYRTFCCVSQDTWNNLSPEQQRALDAELHKLYQTVYHGEEQIPESEKQYALDGETLMGIPGMIFSWQAMNRMPFIRRGQCSEWCGILCANGQTTVAIWIFYTWVHLQTENEWVA